MNAPSQPAPDTVCGSTHCITCGDDGDPMVVLQIDHELELAICRDEDGAESSVEIALVDAVRAGDRLLVHAGTAIARIDEEGAIAAA